MFIIAIDIKPKTFQRIFVYIMTNHTMSYANNKDRNQPLMSIFVLGSFVQYLKDALFKISSPELAFVAEQAGLRLA